MNGRLRVPTSEKLRKALDDLGAEPVEGSGFEDEKPEPEFTGELASVCSQP